MDVFRQDRPFSTEHVPAGPSPGALTIVVCHVVPLLLSLLAHSWLSTLFLLFLILFCLSLICRLFLLLGGGAREVNIWLIVL